MNKEDGMKKVKFYDRWFWVLGISLVLFFVGIFVIDYENNPLYPVLIISIFSIFISFAVITVGMLSHEFRRKNWVWFILTIIMLAVGGFGIYVSMAYYFFILRKEFKKGK